MLKKIEVIPLFLYKVTFYTIYFPNKKNTLYLSGAAWLGRNETTRDMLFENLNEADSILSYSDRLSIEDGGRNGYEVNGGWQKKFKN